MYGALSETKPCAAASLRPLRKAQRGLLTYVLPAAQQPDPCVGAPAHGRLVASVCERLAAGVRVHLGGRGDGAGNHVAATRVERSRRQNAILVVAPTFPQRRMNRVRPASVEPPVHEGRAAILRRDVAQVVGGAGDDQPNVEQAVIAKAVRGCGVKVMVCGRELECSEGRHRLAGWERAAGTHRRWGRKARRQRTSSGRN